MRPHARVIFLWLKKTRMGSLFDFKALRNSDRGSFRRYRGMDFEKEETQAYVSRMWPPVGRMSPGQKKNP
jgi:hypothetical protein